MTIYPIWATNIKIGEIGVFEWFLRCKDLVWIRFSAPTLPAIALYIYNQGIAAWLSVGLLISQRNNLPVLLLLYSLMFLFAPIPTFGLLPAMAYWVLRHFKRTLSIENIVGILVFVIVGIYFISNNQAKNPTPDKGTALLDYVWKLGLFLICSYMVYFPYVWGKIKTDLFFWIMFVTVSIVPFFILTDEPDLGCRVGVPLTFYFALVVLKAASGMRSWSKFKQVCFIVTFLIGAVETCGMYSRNVYIAYWCVLSEHSWQSHWIPTVFDEEKCCLKDNFVASGESLFTKYLMKNDNQDSNEDTPS